MKTADFFRHFHDASKRDGYAFFFDGKTFDAPQQMSANKQLLVQCLMSLSRASVGLPILFQKTGLYEQHKEKMVEDLKRLQSHCDLIGIKDSYGSCLLRTAISADETSDESLVGRLAMIHEQAQKFQKYAADLNPLKARPWVKKVMGLPEGGRVWCRVFLTFSTHKRAKEFLERHISKCKHGGFWKHTHTHPYVVDLEDEIIQGCSGKKDQKLSDSMFKGQSA
jgi:hypothetical protein